MADRSSCGCPKCCAVIAEALRRCGKRVTKAGMVGVGPPRKREGALASAPQLLTAATTLLCMLVNTGSSMHDSNMRHKEHARSGIPLWVANYGWQFYPWTPGAVELQVFSKRLHLTCALLVLVLDIIQRSAACQQCWQVVTKLNLDHKVKRLERSVVEWKISWSIPKSTKTVRKGSRPFKKKKKKYQKFWSLFSLYEFLTFITSHTDFLSLMRPASTDMVVFYYFSRFFFFFFYNFGHFSQRSLFLPTEVPDVVTSNWPTEGQSARAGCIKHAQPLISPCMGSGTENKFQPKFRWRTLLSDACKEQLQWLLPFCLSFSLLSMDVTSQESYDVEEVLSFPLSRWESTV